MKKIASLFLLLSLCQLAFADDEKDKDHHHHEDLTETQLGTVHFPVSCAASVQQPFQRGVALLHSFWYEEAEKEFLDIAKVPNHPFREEALSDLQIYLGDDFGTDWGKWNAEIEKYLKTTNAP